MKKALFLLAMLALWASPAYALVLNVPEGGLDYPNGNFKAGIEIVANDDVNLTSFNVSSYCTATYGYVTFTNGTVINSVALSSFVAAFPAGVSLTNGTHYYLLVDKNSSNANIRYGDLTGQWPFTNEHINATNGAYYTAGWQEDIYTRNVINITTAEITVPPTSINPIIDNTVICFKTQPVCINLKDSTLIYKGEGYYA